MQLPSVALDSGIPARMTGLIVQYLKMNILQRLKRGKFICHLHSKTFMSLLIDYDCSKLALMLP